MHVICYFFSIQQTPSTINMNLNDMLANPAALQHILATMQATQEQFRFPVEYDNSAEAVDLKSVDRDALTQRAVTLFKDRKPGYNVKNIKVDLLVARVLKELEPQQHKRRVTLTNGCCTTEACPTTIFIGCVLDSLSNNSTSQ